MKQKSRNGKALQHEHVTIIDRGKQNDILHKKTINGKI